MCNSSSSFLALGFHCRTSGVDRNGDIDTAVRRRTAPMDPDGDETAKRHFAPGLALLGSRDGVVHKDCLPSQLITNGLLKEVLVFDARVRRSCSTRTKARASAGRRRRRLTERSSGKAMYGNELASRRRRAAGESRATFASSEALSPSSSVRIAVARGTSSRSSI
jgi:hypothetical protein